MKETKEASSLEVQSKTNRKERDINYSQMEIKLYIQCGVDRWGDIREDLRKETDREQWGPKSAQ